MEAVRIEQTRAVGRYRRPASLVLENTALPDEEVTEDYVQRATTEWLPGSQAEPIVQVHGRSYGPITLTGEWDDTNLGQGGTADLHASAQRILEDGAPVSLTWGDRIQLVGLVTRYQPTHIDERRIRWSLTIEPHKVERDVPARPTVQIGTPPDVLRARSQRYAAELLAQAAAARAAQSLAFARLVVSGGRSLASSSMETAATVLEFGAAACTSAGVARTRDQWADVAALGAALDSRCATLQADLDALDLTGFTDAADQVAAWAWESGVRLALGGSLAAAIIIGRQASALVTGGEARRSYIVRSGDTLQRIAAAELDDWTAWRSIADLNRIAPGVALTPGLVLLLPDLTGIRR